MSLKKDVPGALAGATGKNSGSEKPPLEHGTIGKNPQEGFFDDAARFRWVVAARNALRQMPDAKSSDLRVATVLAEIAGPDGTLIVGSEDLARRLEMRSDSLRYHIRRLREAGCLESWMRGQGRAAGRRLVFPAAGTARAGRRIGGGAA